MYITMTISQVRKSRNVGSRVFSNLPKATQLIRDVAGRGGGGI